MTKDGCPSPHCTTHTWLYGAWAAGPLRPPDSGSLGTNLDPHPGSPVLLLDALCRQIHICIPSRTRCWFLAYISLFPRFRNQNSSMIATASHIVSQGPAMCPTPNWALYLVHQPRRTSALHGQFCRVWFLHPHPRSQEWSAFQKQNSKGIPYF